MKLSEKTRVESVEKVAEEEENLEKCVYKRARAAAYEACSVCDGFNYNCISYKIQQKYLFQKEIDAGNLSGSG